MGGSEKNMYLTPSFHCLFSQVEKPFNFLIPVLESEDNTLNDCCEGNARLCLNHRPSVNIPWYRVTYF